MFAGDAVAMSSQQRNPLLVLKDTVILRICVDHMREIGHDSQAEIYQWTAVVHQSFGRKTMGQVKIL